MITKFSRIKNIIFPNKKTNYIVITILFLGVITGALFSTMIDLNDNNIYVNEINTLDCYDISINIVSDHFSSKLIPLWNDVWIDDSFDEICMRKDQYHAFSDDAPYYRSKSFYIAASALEQR